MKKFGLNCKLEVEMIETQDAQVEKSQEERLKPSPVQWGQISNVNEIPATSLKAKLGVLAADSILKMRWRFRYSSRLLSKRPGLGPQLSAKKFRCFFSSRVNKLGEKIFTNEI